MAIELPELRDVGQGTALINAYFTPVTPCERANAYPELAPEIRWRLDVAYRASRAGEDHPGRILLPQTIAKNVQG